MPQTLDHLEDNIRRVIAHIRPQMLEKVIENWTSRLDYIRASLAVICQKSYLECKSSETSNCIANEQYRRRHVLRMQQSNMQPDEDASEQYATRLEDACL
ncbi:hypothetical protein TNCV_152211 [Trichonephila clavipes]|uniref:Uncharacterized protein n=1 Tax=Trichonephila clavipes TaxID=2585209 RepID=A0A8X6RG03_TRICX|nr:hypothetical protein TNCV_152211 [Trichonephila clavipes]